MEEVNGERDFFAHFLRLSLLRQAHRRSFKDTATLRRHLHSLGTCKTEGRPDCGCFRVSFSSSPGCSRKFGFENKGHLDNEEAWTELSGAGDLAGLRRYGADIAQHLAFDSVRREGENGKFRYYETSQLGLIFSSTLVFDIA